VLYDACEMYLTLEGYKSVLLLYFLYSKSQHMWLHFCSPLLYIIHLNSRQRVQACRPRRVQVKGHQFRPLYRPRRLQLIARHLRLPSRQVRRPLFRYVFNVILCSFASQIIDY